MQRRILLLNTDLEIGGTPTVVRELAIRLRDLGGAHVEVVGLSSAGPLLDQLWSRQIKCTPLGADGPKDFPRTLHRLSRLVRQERIDTVLSFLIHANTMAAALRPLWPRARYFQSIQTTQPNPQWHWSLQRWVHRAAERIIVPSPSIAQAAARWSGISREKFAVIPNAIDIADFAAGASYSVSDQICSNAVQLEGYAATGEKTLTPALSRVQERESENVTFIGRLDPIKRLGDLIQAMTLTAPNACLNIYGDGPQLSLLQSLVARLNLSGRVKFHGVASSPQRALATADVLVLPSDAEGFGLVLIEAMAAGVPVIATDVPGIRDVVIADTTGMLVPPRSPAALARAITVILADAELRNRLVAAAMTDVRRRFTWDAVWPEYARLLGF